MLKISVEVIIVHKIEVPFRQIWIWPNAIVQQYVHLRVQINAVQPWSEYTMQIVNVLMLNCTRVAKAVKIEAQKMTLLALIVTAKCNLRKLMAIN